MIILQDVYTSEQAPYILYQLLRERTVDQSISHKDMPTLRQHLNFIDSKPYPHWYLIKPENENVYYGSIYFTAQREVGLFIFKNHHRKGIGREAFRKLINLCGYPIFANVNPDNKNAVEFWKTFSSKICQITYKVDGDITVE